MGSPQSEIVVQEDRSKQCDRAIPFVRFFLTCSERCANTCAQLVGCSPFGIVLHTGEVYPMSLSTGVCFLASRRHARKMLQVLWATMALLTICVPSFSQSNQGTIQGAVLDQSGGAVVGATVTVTDVARGISRDLVTDDAGQYVATSLNPGTYTVRVEAKGFRAEEHTNVLVEVGQNIRVDLEVQPGEQTQTITVSGEVPAINTTDATLGGTVSNLAINQLPL